MRRHLDKVREVLVKVLLLALLLPVLAVLLVVLIVQRIWLWRYRVRRHNDFLLVATTRHGWREFVLNNLAPILPKGTELVWFRRNPDDTPTHRALTYSGIRLKRPYLARVTSSAIRVRPLHDDLLGFKYYGETDPQVQERVAPIVDRARAELGEER